MNESLHDDLRALVPPPPVTGGWGPEVRRRGRSRRVGVVGALGVVVVAGAVWLSASLLGGPVQVASPAPSESGPVRIDEGYTGVEAQACADLRAGRLTPAEPSGDLPDGATRAWLCGPQDPYPFAGQLGPREPLSSGADRIVAAFNAMPEVDPDESVACHAVGGLTYAVILEYADGPVVLDGETVNCEFVAGRIGEGARFLAALEGFWEEARATSPAPVGALDLCANRSLDEAMNYSYGFGSFLADSRGDLTRGVVCGVAADATDLNAPTVMVPLPDAVVRDLATATLEPYTPDPLGEAPTLRPAYVVLVNRFGDPVTYVLGNDGEAFVNQPDGVHLWRAGEDVAARWSDVLAQVRVSPFYQPPEVCGGYDPATMTGDPAKAVSGTACAPPDALPAKGPELDPALAGEIARLFADGAGEEWGQMNSANFVVLTDSEGAVTRLYWDGTLPGRLVQEGSGASRPLPDHVRIALEEYGLSFVPE